jgi:hypothetical protein
MSCRDTASRWTGSHRPLRSLTPSRHSCSSRMCDGGPYKGTVLQAGHRRPRDGLPTYLELEGGCGTGRPSLPEARACHGYHLCSASSPPRWGAHEALTRHPEETMDDQSFVGGVRSGRWGGIATWPCCEEACNCHHRRAGRVTAISSRFPRPPGSNRGSFAALGSVTLRPASVTSRAPSRHIAARSHPRPVRRPARTGLVNTPAGYNRPESSRVVSAVGRGSRRAGRVHRGRAAPGGRRWPGRDRARRARRWCPPPARDRPGPGRHARTR